MNTMPIKYLLAPALVGIFTTPAAMAASTDENTLKAEYFVDVDPGMGQGEQLNATPGVNDWRLPLSDLSAGAHIFGIRVVDSEDCFTTTVMLPLYVVDERSYADMEYYIDADPGYGKGVRTGLNGEETVTFNVATEGLSFGAHTLNVRIQDGEGEWSNVMTRPFIVTEGIADDAKLSLEYFYDEDPGMGAATQVELSAGVNTFYLPVDSRLEAGAHIFGVRCCDENGKWTPTIVNPLYIMPPAEFSILEYYVDKDPGKGSANGVAMTGDISCAFTVSTTGLELGEHTLALRGQTPDGKWVDLFSRDFAIKAEDSGVNSVEWKAGLKLALRGGELTVYPSEMPASTIVEVYSLDGLMLGRAEWADPGEALTIEVGGQTRIIVSAVTPAGKRVVETLIK